MRAPHAPNDAPPLLTDPPKRSKRKQHNAVATVKAARTHTRPKSPRQRLELRLQLQLRLLIQL